MSLFKLELRSKTAVQKLSLGSTHIAAMTGNASYPAGTRVPTDAAVQAAHDALQTAVDEADAAEIVWKQKNATRRELESAYAQVLTARANNCEAVTPNDIPALTSTGFPLKGAAVPSTPLTAPQNVRASLGDQEGEIDLMWDAQKGAVSHIVEFKEHLAAGEWTSAGVLTQSKHTVTGLTPGTSYAFRVRAVGKDGEGPWSDETVKRAP